MYMYTHIDHIMTSWLCVLRMRIRVLAASGWGGRATAAALPVHLPVELHRQRDRRVHAAGSRHRRRLPARRLRHHLHLDRRRQSTGGEGHVPGLRFCECTTLIAGDSVFVFSCVAMCVHHLHHLYMYIIIHHVMYIHVHVMYVHVNFYTGTCTYGTCSYIMYIIGCTFVYVHVRTQLYL